MTDFKPNIRTLRKLIEQHPDWLDYPMVISGGDHCYDGYEYVDVYLNEGPSEEEKAEWTEEDKENNRDDFYPVIVFSDNK